MFKTGIPYTRTEIQKLIGGGEIQSYLPQRKGLILAGCFSAEMNPDAPSIIQAGKLPKVKAKAELLSRQPKTIFPVFLKAKMSSRDYLFQGYFKFKGITNTEAAIAEAELRSGRHGELAYVIHLNRTELIS